MTLETELKVHIENPKELRKKLIAYYGNPHKILKKDSYYRHNSKDIRQSVRLRMQNNTCLITLKERRINENIEQNIEHEFEVSNNKTFETFLEMIGFTLEYKKEKNIESFYNESEKVLYELTYIAPLGWFLEIETLTSNFEQDMKKAREKILCALKELGYNESHIEARSYKSLLGY